MSQTRSVTLERAALHALVWSKPMIHAAAGLGISGNGLANICRRLDIPYPPRGYWARLRAGKTVRRTPLPKAGPNVPTVATITPTPPVRQHKPDPVEVALKSAAVLPAVTVPSDLRRTHPIIARRIKEERDRERESRHSRWSVYTPPTGLDKRKWRIESALYKALEKRGHTLEPASDRPRDVRFVVDGERINYGLYERMHHRRARLTQADREAPGQYNSADQTWKQWKEPTGLLKFTAHADIFGRYRQKEWVETAEAPLEIRLGEIIVAMEAIARLAGDERVRRAERDRIRREEEHQRYLERRATEHDEKRWARFREIAAAWEECDRLRRFLEALSARAAESPPSEGVEKRLAWARDRLAAMDPLSKTIDAVAADIDAVAEGP